MQILISSKAFFFLDTKSFLSSQAKNSLENFYQKTSQLRRDVVVITTAQLHSTKSELRFCPGSKFVCGVLEICDGEDLWQWSRLEIRLNAFCRSTIPQKQFIIIIIIIITSILISKAWIETSAIWRRFLKGPI